MTQRNEIKMNLNELLTSVAKTGISYEPTNALPANCAEAIQKSGRNEGVHKINVTDSVMKPFYIYCLTHNDSDKTIDDPIRANATTAWTIIQRRRDGSIKFNRKWEDYRQGFGNLDGEYFIGLDKLHALTQSALHELWVQLEDFEGDKRWAKYNSFAIDDESKGYRISTLGTYSGDAGDSLKDHLDQKFSTEDMDNDNNESYNCASRYFGGWWYRTCFDW